MKIVHRTTYSTKASRWLVTQVHRIVSKHEGRLPAWQWKALRIEVEYRRWPG